MASQQDIRSNTSFIALLKMSAFSLKHWIDRRVPHIVGLYLGTAWGLIQFIEWVVERYGFSPVLPDFALVLMMSLLPSVGVVAYFHGSPGPDKWTPVEKITVPVNLMLAAVLLFGIFYGKDLGATTQTIEVINESGENVAHVVPKNSFRKKIALFAYRNSSNVNTNDWLAAAIPTALGYDLAQDIFIQTEDYLNYGGNLSLLKLLRQRGADNPATAPLALIRDVADQLHCDNFVVGEIKQTDAGLVIETRLFNTDSGQLVSSHTTRKQNDFGFIDGISQHIKDELNIATTQAGISTDLPLVEIFSAYDDAIADFTAGLQAVGEDNDYPRALNLLENAVAADNQFALAWMLLGWVRVLSGADQVSSETALNTALKYEYKLPDPIKLDLRQAILLMQGESKKVIALLEMTTELYPDNISHYLNLINNYLNGRQFEKSLRAYEKIQSLVSDPETYLDDIARVYFRMNDFDRALTTMQDYSRYFPDQALPYVFNANVHGLLGDEEKARENLEKALFLEPQNEVATVILMELNFKHLLPPEIMAEFERRIQTLSSPQRRGQAYQTLSTYQQIFGQPRAAVASLRLAHAELERYQSPVNAYLLSIEIVSYLVELGETEQARAHIAEGETILQGPLRGLSSLGYLLYYLALEDTAQAEHYLGVFEQAVERLSTTAAGFEESLLFVKSRIAELNDNLMEAVQLQLAVVEIATNKAGPYLRLGKLQRLTEDYAAATTSIEYTLADLPLLPEAHYERGLLYLQDNDPEAARDAFAKAIELWQYAEPGFKKLDDAIAAHATIDPG